MKKYEFNYDFNKAECGFEVTEKYTEEMALATLEFFSWDYDNDGNPVDEAVKKIALQCIKEATAENWNEVGVISAFENMEGFPLIDGSRGIKLTHVSGLEFEDEELEMEIQP